MAIVSLPQDRFLREPSIISAGGGLPLRVPADIFSGSSRTAAEALRDAAITDVADELADFAANPNLAIILTITGTTPTTIYQVYRNSDWADVTQAIRGPQGQRGSSGSKGEPGNTGSKGEPGNQGDPGPKGAVGASGTAPANAVQTNTAAAQAVAAAEVTVQTLKITPSAAGNQIHLTSHVDLNATSGGGSSGSTGRDSRVHVRLYRGTDLLVERTYGEQGVRASSPVHISGDVEWLDIAPGTDELTYTLRIHRVGGMSWSATDRQMFAQELLISDSKGDKGDLGSMGDPGPAGQKGESGNSGPKGDQGDQGDQGPKGEDGAAGAAGQKGEAGAPGQKGEMGAAGPKGEMGAKGERGEKGE